MATTISRVTARRRLAIDEALDHAELIMAERGAGAVTVAAVAREMGIKPPSLYKYFPSLHAIYDGLFARGNARLAAYVDEAVSPLGPGLDRLLESCRAMLRWGSANPGLAPLLFWRPIPGFEPSPESFAQAEELVTRARTDLAAAVRAGDLAPDADTDETLRLLTAVTAGIGSQQLANQPGSDYETGLFTSLTDRALDMWVEQHAGPHRKGRP